MLQPKSAYLKCSYLFKESKACRILSVKFPWVVLLVGGAAGCGGGVPRKLNQTNQIFELNQIKPNQFKCLICLIDGHTGYEPSCSPPSFVGFIMLSSAFAYMP
jgi:hypothetical protein